MIWITEAKALAGYCLHIRFSDGTEGQVDLRTFVFDDHRAIVAELRDPAVFSSIRVESDTVVWDNGFDLAPEFLYQQAHARSLA